LPTTCAGACCRPWSKDTRLAFSTINARLESVAEKPAFRGAWQQRRALVPATGYYEWPVFDGRKRPHYIRIDGSPVMLMGGLWESRSNGAGGQLLTFSIVTREADPVIAPVHDRMPLILPPESLRDWLHGSPRRRHGHRPCRAGTVPLSSTKSTPRSATSATRART
jgi:putative SOS response-associated peptidase YedK